MANFLAELKRRNIYRVGAFYAVVAWVLLQLIANVAPILELPPWVARAFLLLLVIGFPLAILLAWTREPEGDPTQRAITGSLDWALMGALAVVIALVSYQQFASTSGIATTTQKPGVETARVAAASPVGAISIAVLPFANLSDDASQEFFSDGMTEEIVTALARIPDLRVVARGSASQFKGERRDLRAVGQALGATHLIEGSVRRAGTQLRITAQLVKADDGVNVWVNSYDRQLTDVFAIQEDIATAIAGALRMPLGLAPGERLVSSRSIDPESYQQFLRAKVLVRARGTTPIPAAIKILEPLVARNPDYAPALAQLAAAYAIFPTYSRGGSADEIRRTTDEFFPKAEAMAKRAIQLDPSLADGYLALGRVQFARGKLLLAEELFSKALALDPNYPEALTLNSNLHANVGRLKESLALRQQLRALEPYIPNTNAEFAELLWLNGQTDAAIEVLKNLPPVGNRAFDLAMIYAAMGRYSEAVDAVQELPSTPISQAAISLLRTAPAAAASPQGLPRLDRLWFVYPQVGASGRALDYYENLAAGGFFAIGGTENAYLWHSSYAPIRKTERFKALVRKNGMVEYWRAKGWPEFCRPTTRDDFACG